MRTPAVLAVLALAASGCASPAPPPPAPAPIGALPEEFYAEQDALEREGYSDEEDLALRRRWIGRFRELTRCGDPRTEDEAYGAWAGLLANLVNAGLEEGVDRELLPLFLEWSERYPASEQLGQDLWLLINGEEALRAPGAGELLERLSRSPADAVARGALMTSAERAEDLGRPEEAVPLLGEVVRRWPDSFEGMVARRKIAFGALEPGRTAPEFALPDLGGRKVPLSSHRGRVVLLVFFGFG